MIDRYDNLMDMPITESFLLDYLCESELLWEKIRDGHEEWAIKLKNIMDGLGEMHDNYS